MREPGKRSNRIKRGKIAEKEVAATLPKNNARLCSHISDHAILLNIRPRVVAKNISR